MKSIILFFKKLFAWILTLFLDRNRTSKNKKKVVVKKEANKKDAKFVLSNDVSHRDEDMGENHIIDIYPYTKAEDLKSIYELVDKLKEKIIKEEKYEEEDIKKLEKIKEIVNEELNISQVEQIKDVLIENIEEEKVLEEEHEEGKEVSKEVPEKELSAHEKILNIQKDIDEIMDNKLNKHEKDLIEQAYYKYEKVNYVIATTVEIDEIEKDLNNLIDEIEVNNYKKSYYVSKAKEIKKKIERLEKINKNPQVQEEIKRLKEDFYTKSVDKYDILYNKEVFVSLSKRCDDALELLNNKEKQVKEERENRKAQKAREREEREERYQQKQEERAQKREEREREKDEYYENIIKRYRDLKISNAIILANIMNHSAKMGKKNIIEVLRDDYDLYLEGEHNDFIFDRNRKKTEVCKLYNNLLQVLSDHQKVDYQPLTHINYPYYNLLEETIGLKTTVDDLAFKKSGYDMLVDEKSVAVSDKLGRELSLEKENRRSKGLQDRVLIRKIGEQ